LVSGVGRQVSGKENYGIKAVLILDTGYSILDAGFQNFNIEHPESSIEDHFFDILNIAIKD
jgi:hypothetical protein